MLTGFRAQNHPQQIGARGALDEVDDRGTHPENFAEFDAEFGPFTLDVAAAPHNAKCTRYFTRADDGLAQSWAGGRVWCNPPYSDLGAWLAKAWSELDSTHGIVMLLPANRVEQRWWQDHVEPFRDQPDGRLRVRFLPGRLRFERPGVVIGPKGDRPPFGCCLLIFTPTATAPEGRRVARRDALHAVVNVLATATPDATEPLLLPLAHDLVDALRPDLHRPLASARSEQP